MSKKKEEENINSNKIKIILLGESGVGKTCLINAFLEKKFSNQLMSNSFTPTYKELKIDNIKYEIQLWDTAGQEKYRSISKIFFKDSHIIIFVYEILSPKSFSELAFWTDYVKEYSPEIVVLGVAANKTDLLTQVHKSEDLVSKEEGEKYAKDIGALFCETSAKEDPDGFEEFIKQLVKKYLSIGNKINNDEKRVTLSNYKKKKKKGCC